MWGLYKYWRVTFQAVSLIFSLPTWAALHDQPKGMRLLMES